MSLTADRCKESSTTTGTGTLTLAGVAAGAFQALVSAKPVGSRFTFTIVGSSGASLAANEWETCNGVLLTSTTLSREFPLNGSSGKKTLVNFSAGSKDVFITIPEALTSQVFNAKAFGAQGDAKWRRPGVLTSGSSTLNIAGSTFVASDAGKFIFLQGGGTTRTVTDGAITTGTGTLTSATGAFTSADLGKHIEVAGAGAAGAVLNTQIVKINSGTSVRLNNVASTTVSGATCKISGNLVTTIASVTDANNVVLASGNSPVSLTGVHFIFGTDDTLAIQGAIAAAVAVGGTCEITGQSIITATLALPSQVTLRGDGVAGSVFDLGTQNLSTGSVLFWCGASQGTMVKVAPTQTAVLVPDVVIENLLIHGNKLANTGLRLEACTACVVRNVSVKQTLLRGIDLNTTDFPGYTPNLNYVDGTVLDSIYLHPCAAGAGLYLDGIASGTSDQDVGQCSFRNFRINYEDGNAVDAVNASNDVFHGMFFSRVTGGTGIGIELHGGNDHRCARNLHFYGCMVAAGGVVARATGLVRPTFGHVFYGYSTASSTPVPTIENGAGLIYSMLDGTYLDGTIKPGSPVEFGGSLGLNIAAAYGFHQLGGRSRLQAVATPAAPTVALGGGSGTGTNRTYWVIAEDVNGNKTLASPATTFSGPASLTTTNWQKITWAPVAGAVKYYILRNTTTTLTADTLLTLTGTWSSNTDPTAAGTNRGNIVGVQNLVGGSGYTNGTFTDGTVSANGFTGSGGTFAYTIAGGIVTNIAITNGGTNYIAPTFTLGASAGAGTGFSCNPIVAVGSGSGGVYLEAHDTGQAANGVLAIPTRNGTSDSIVDGNMIVGAASAIAVGTVGVTTNSASSATTAETKSLIGSAVVGTFTLPANFMVVGRKLRLKLTGILTTGGTAGTITIFVKFAGTTIASTGAVAPTISQSNKYWEAEIDIICRTAGASGTFFVQGKFSVMNAATPAAMITWPIRGNSADPPAAVTVDTTASSLVDFQSTTSNALHTITGNMASLEVLA